MAFVYGAAEASTENPRSSTTRGARSGAAHLWIYCGEIMKVCSCLVAGILGLSVVHQAGADAISHRQAAEAFYSVAVGDDPEKMASVVTEMISRLRPDLQRHEAILREFARDIVLSKKYADARIKVYQDLLSEEELRALTELFRDPVYQKFLTLRLDIVRRNAEETIGLFQDELPELARRINENSQTADPADR